MCLVQGCCDTPRKPSRHPATPHSNFATVEEGTREDFLPPHSSSVQLITVSDIKLGRHSTKFCKKRKDEGEDEVRVWGF